MIKKLFHAIRTRARNVLFQGAAFAPLAKYSGTPLEGIYSSTAVWDLGDFLGGFFKFAIAVGAIAAILRIAYAGYLYMGSDITNNKGRAKTILTDVVIGLLLLLSIWIILYQINPNILKIDLLKTLNESEQKLQQQREANRAGSAGE